MHEAVNMPDGNFTIIYSYFCHQKKKKVFDNLVRVPAHVNIKLGVIIHSSGREVDSLCKLRKLSN